jgi:hypothetical protein
VTGARGVVEELARAAALLARDEDAGGKVPDLG